MEWTGRVAVITGGASGIGLAVARECKKRGMKVVVADIDAKALAAVSTEFDMATKCDAVDPVQVKALADKVYDKYGDVGFLHSNTGILAGDSGFKTPLDVWKRVMDVTFTANYVAATTFVPLMLAQKNKNAVLVITASIAGLMNSTDESGTPYTVAKFASRVYTEGLARELKDTPIRVHCLCPGPVNTALLKNSRIDPNKALFEFEKRGGKGLSEAALAKGLQPTQVASKLFAGIEAKKFYIVVTSPTLPPTVVSEFMRCVADDQDNGVALPLSYKEGGSHVVERFAKAVERAMAAGKSKL